MNLGLNLESCLSIKRQRVSNCLEYQAGMTIDLFERSPPRQSLEVILLLCIATYVIRSPISRTRLVDRTTHSGCSTTFETHGYDAERNTRSLSE